MLILSKNLLKLALILILAAQLSGAAVETGYTTRENHGIEHNVSVSAMIMPLFAIDSRGNPVHNLKPDELKLFVNKKPVDFRLNRVRFDNAGEIATTTATQSQAQPQPGATVMRQDKRIVFVILDAIFNNADGYKRGKRIAGQLAERGNPGDLFIIMKISPVFGLEYVTGPEPASESLLKAIRNIKLEGDFFAKNTDREQNRIPRFDASEGGNEHFSNRPGSYYRNSWSDRMQYQTMAKRFAYLLSQFQHALYTITKPKVVFLISEGLPSEAFNGISRKPGNKKGPLASYYKQYLGDIARSINNGGSVLYAINPGGPLDGLFEDSTGSVRRNLGGTSLDYLARTSGGKYFEGSDVKKMVTHIKKTTSAYYEISFALGRIKEKDMNFRVECLRKGVHIHTLKNARKGNPYSEMSTLERKIFALNVVHDGTWSRMAGRVAKAKINSLKKVPGKKAGKREIELDIPGHMANKKVDIFLIETGPKGRNTSVTLINQPVKQVERIVVSNKATKKMKQFIVMIEPSTPYCIYTSIK